jgi:prepilin-type N-terminal cleavage/methylation domain-containing protein
MNNSSLYQRSYEHIQETKGFTLLELIVVCALIGIMLTISVPSLRSAFFTNPLKSTARQVVGIINEVRQTAVRNQEPYNLHISQLENRIWYEKAAEEKEDAIEDDSDTLKKRELQLPDTVTLSRVWLQSSGVLSGDKTTFWISKKGYMEQAAIQLLDDSDNSLSVQLNPFTDPIAVSDVFPPSSP